MANATHAISRNPATGEQIGAYAFESAADLDTVLAQSTRAYATWRGTPLAERSAALSRLGAALRANIDRLAQMITAEMGKPITQARGEINKCAGLCDWYAEHGPALLATEPTQVEND